MKNIALIVLGIVAAVIAAFVGLIMTQPPAKMTIQAIRPTGNFFTHTNGNRTTLTVQSWEFGITNVSRARAHWIGDIQARRVNDSDDSDPATAHILYDGMLMPGEGIVTNMIVPAGDKIEWAGTLSYFPEPTTFQRHLWDLGFKTPGLKNRMMNLNMGGTAQTPWHTTTNAPTASSAVTNTP